MSPALKEETAAQILQLQLRNFVRGRDVFQVFSTFYESRETGVGLGLGLRKNPEASY